jgi:hypothetical protein
MFGMFDRINTGTINTQQLHTGTPFHQRVYPFVSINFNSSFVQH